MTAGKRAFDIGLALILSTALVPMGAVVLAFVLILDGRPAFYVSERSGAGGRNFRLWKFRTLQAAHGDAGVAGGHNSSRITRTGRFLRRTRFDEFPQLWNVFMGDMSFVGPRPPLPSVAARFPDIYARVLRSRPGITGLASVFFADHEAMAMAGCADVREAEAVYYRRCVARKARLDLIYQRRRGICMDMWLIWLTAGRAFGLMPAGTPYRARGRK